MAKKRQQPKRLFKQEHISSYKTDLSPTARMKQMTRDHSDILQNIEFILLEYHSEFPETDDRLLAEALRASLGGGEPAAPRAEEIVDRLAALRRTRDDVAEDLWRDGLRVIRDSIRRHSELRPGETTYIKFVSQYVQ